MLLVVDGMWCIILTHRNESVWSISLLIRQLHLQVKDIVLARTYLNVNTAASRADVALAYYNHVNNAIRSVHIHNNNLYITRALKS